MEDEGLTELWNSMMGKIFDGFLLEVMIVVTPAAVAISAAISFVSIPPVPRLDPRVAVLTIRQTVLFEFQKVCLFMKTSAHLQSG